MAYYTYDQIRWEAKFQNPKLQNSTRKSLSTRNTVFLSHSHQDADLIVAAMNFLLTLELEIYVDWLDEEMPAITSGETATKIKKKIAECDRFVVLLSDYSVNSKWVPWELGYADGVKDINTIAIMPIRRSQFTYDSEFNGIEYMSLYPVIREGDYDGGKKFPTIVPPKRLGGDGLGYRLESNWLRPGGVVRF